ncbi:hypothetical protein C8J56DRAFT_153630 [Mycena floridula]|nr:hypothetical protein C8J56DRAFT_153630 [Mycena floridula]
MEDSIQMSDAQLSGDERRKRADGEDRRKRGLDDEGSLDEERTKRILILDDKPPKRRRVVAPSPLNSNSHFTSKSDVHAPSQSHSARLSRIFERRQVILAGRTASQAEAVEDSQREMGSPRREIDGDDSELSEMVTELEEMGAEDSEFRDDKQDSDSKSEKGAEDEGEDRRSASPEEDETGKDRADEKESKETEEQQSCYRLGDGRRFYCTVPGATCKTGPFRDRYLARRHARNVHGLGGAPDVRCPIPGCRSKLHDREACKRHVEKTHPGKWRGEFCFFGVVGFCSGSVVWVIG